jgi:hypothetical protein
MVNSLAFELRGDKVRLRGGYENMPQIGRRGDCALKFCLKAGRIGTVELDGDDIESYITVLRLK